MAVHGRLFSEPARYSPAQTRSNEAGFTLAEIAVALGIFSFALVSMMGMLSVGLKNSLKATVQTSASNVLAGIVSDIKAAQPAPVNGQTRAFTTPKLNISATINLTTNTVDPDSIRTPNVPLWLNESCAVHDPKSTEMLQKLYSVQILPSAQNVPALRVRVEWPAMRLPNAKPEGYLETLVPLPLDTP